MVAAATGDETTRGYGLCLMSLAQLYAHRYDEAMTTAREAEEIARETSDADLVALSRMAVVGVQAIVGDLEAAYEGVRGLRDAGRAARVEAPAPPKAQQFLLDR